MNQARNLLECLKKQGQTTAQVDVILAAVAADERDQMLICNNCRCPICGATKRRAQEINRSQAAKAKQKERTAGLFMNMTSGDDSLVNPLTEEELEDLANQPNLCR